MVIFQQRGTPDYKNFLTKFLRCRYNTLSPALCIEKTRKSPLKVQQTRDLITRATPGINSRARIFEKSNYTTLPEQQ